MQNPESQQARDRPMPVAEHARGRRRRATASAAGSIAIVGALSFFATCAIASTRSGDRLFASEGHAVAPAIAFEAARPLLMAATALLIVTVATWLLLVIAAPAREARRKSVLELLPPRPKSRVQRYRSAIVLLAGVSPILLGGALPFAAKFLPMGFQVDTNSAVGTSVLDVVIGCAVPVTLLGVLYFRWVARLSGASTEPDFPPASVPRPPGPKHV